jgi:hypothetical protein
VATFKGGRSNSHNYGDGRESTEAEIMTYQVSTNGVSSLAISNTSYFAIPVTFGVSFEFALYANAASRQGTNAGFFLGQNQTSVDFGHTISYAGGAYFLGTDNSTITNLTYTSASGFDYQNAAIPEPATWLLGGLSLLVGATWRKTRSRRRHNASPGRQA